MSATASAYHKASEESPLLLPSTSPRPRFTSQPPSSLFVSLTLRFLFVVCAASLPCIPRTSAQIHDTHGLSYSVSTGVPGSGSVVGTGAPAVESTGSTAIPSDLGAGGGNSRELPGHLEGGSDELSGRTQEASKTSTK
jgi:hypothetical protein